MFGFLKPAPKPAKREAAPEWVTLRGGLEFPIAQHLARHHGYPIADWAKVRAWVDGLDPAARRGEAWSACERAWLLHFRDALGKDFRLEESGSAALVSSLAPNFARAALEFIARTERRIGAVLKGVVQPAPWGAAACRSTTAAATSSA